MIVREACVKLGITRKEFYRRASISQTSFTGWIRGARVPERRVWARVAAAVNRPELMDRRLMPYTTTWYDVTCTKKVSEKCVGTKSVKYSDIIRCQHKHEPRKSGAPHDCSYEIDEETVTGTFVCLYCYLEEEGWGHKWNVALRKPRVREKWLNDLAEARAKGDPEKFRENGTNAARAVNQGRHRSEQEKEHIAVAKMSPRPEKTILQCLFCGDLIGLALSSRGKGMLHRPCWVALGGKYPAESIAPPDRLSEVIKGSLKDMWELTWRHVVLDEVIIRTDGSGLAKEFKIGRATAYTWIHFVLDRLPPDGIAEKWMGKRAEILRKYAKTKGLLAQPTKLVS